MATNKLPAPDEGIKERLHLVDGYLTYTESPEVPERFRGQRVGSGRNIGRTTLRYNGKRYPANRIAHWLNTGGEWPEQVLFCDGDEMNHHASNLKAATTQENSVRGSSSHIEERITKDGRHRFYSRIELLGKSYLIGVYDTYNEALYAGWKVRSVMFPDFTEVPKEIVHEYLKKVLNV